MTNVIRLRPSGARLVAGLLILALGLPAYAQSRLDVRLNTASYVIEDLQAIPEQSIPEALLENAAGIAVIPNVLKLGFGIGARYGRGVLVMRDDDGQWRAPAFITLGSGSFGWQIGAQSSDLVLVFRDRETLTEVTSAKFTLGADASVAAGPVGRQTSAATDIKFDAAVYSYSRSRGLFAGIALDGAVVGIDHENNARFYGEPGIVLQDIMEIDPASVPASARQLIGRLRTTAAAAPQPAAEPAGPDTPEEPGVTTFGIGDAPVEDADQDLPES